MFRSKQDEVRTRGQLLRDELGESFDHAVRAAGHAAGGMKAASTQMRPAANRAREVASQRWGSTVAAFNDADPGKQAQRIRKELRRRRGRPQGRTRQWPRLAGLLAAGAAAGAACAMIMRRRRQREWAEYDPNEALDAVGSSAAAQSAAAMGAGERRATTTSDQSADQPRAGSKAAGRSESGQPSTSSAPAAGQQADEMASRSSGARVSRNGGS